MSCTDSAEVDGGFSDGGTITITTDGAISFVAKRVDRITPTELDSGRPNCAEAAATLQLPR